MPRKKPFSGKKKKQQIQEKRKRQQGTEASAHQKPTKKIQHEDDEEETEKQNEKKEKPKNRLTTVFAKESQEEVEKRKLEATKPLKRLDHFPVDSYYGELIDIPLRPHWDSGMSKEELESQEQRMFAQYQETLIQKYPANRLNYYEQNLEVWRQLWRVCEISDILFMLVDVRHPLFHFPPSLYRYVVKGLQKPLVLVITKTDLVPESVVNLWTLYFRKNFPGLLVTATRSFERDSVGEIAMGKARRRINKKKKQKPTGTRQLIEFMNPLIVQRRGQPLELPESDEKETAGDSGAETDGPESSEEEPEELKIEELKIIENAKMEDHYEVPNNRGWVTLGFIGHPNVGKSTLINTLKGKKVCSTSRTPGHTKYKQTVFLNDTVMLCDCPGLVFPACDVPKVLQVVCGIFPLAQLREPYSAIQYIAERIPLETVYKLEKLHTDQPWTAWEICESYAEKRGYHTQKGRPDTHRSGLEILRDLLDGRVVLYFTPNSAKINVNVYEEGNSGNLLNSEILENSENHEEKVTKKGKSSRKKESSSSEEDSSEDENITTNPYSILDDQ